MLNFGLRLLKIKIFSFSSKCMDQLIYPGSRLRISIVGDTENKLGSEKE